MAGMQTKPVQTKPAAQPTKQPGAMIEKARGMAVGGAMQKPGKPAMQTKPMVRPPMKADGPPPIPELKGPPMPMPGQTPPIFGGEIPDQGPQGPLQLMDGGAMMPGAAPGGLPPEMDPMSGPSAPNMAGGGLNPGAGSAGLPPGMQLPPNLQAAVQAGMDPQAAFDRAMQNRAGFRQRVQAAQQPQAPPPQQGGRFNGPRGIRNLSDVYRGGGAQPGGQLPTKPMPGGPMQAQPTMDPNLGMQYGGGAGFRPQFRPGFGNGSHPFNGYDE